MMVSFETKVLQLSEPQIGELTRTNDFKTHLKIAVEVDAVTENDITGEENDLKLNTNGQMFIEELQNKSVYNNDSAVLTCKLNLPTDEIVEWRKDNKPVEISNNLMVMRKNGNHWLAISSASLEDTGQYSCVCGHISTTADLTVIDEALSVVVDLPAKIEVTENGNIYIECKVNLLTSKPVWRYKGEILQSSGRKVIQANGTYPQVDNH
ncbi:obscurin-like [Ruditapes philippinarum]|uniref:obscurin-like n=1 Tax=Ruditapes philippinarum TaxID=129788 RepID=UPI00295B00FE|nr:obscurin-like [Ruditapes philippinarum]